MGPNAGPKCLLSIQGRTLLQITLDTLRAAGVRNLVLVVGFRKEEVIAEAKARAGSIQLKIVENPRYAEGAILSLWSARDSFQDDLILMDADVLFPQVFLERLVRSRHQSCLLVDGSVVDTGEEQMVFGQGERVLFITKRPSQELRSRMSLFGESVGFLKLSKKGAGVLTVLVEAKVQAGIVDIEHEQLYPELFGHIVVGYERVDGLPWIEIDTPEDLRRAEQEIYPRWAPSRCMNRIIAGWFFPFIARIPLSPNQWTFLSFLVGLAALICIAEGAYAAGFVGAMLFKLFYLMDDWDGAVARLKGLSSRWGGWFDVGVDAVIQTALPLCLATGLQEGDDPEWVFFIGIIAAIGIALDFLMTIWARLRGFGPSIFGDPSRADPAGREGGWRRWIRVNASHENFSLLVLICLALNIRIPFLCLMALGAQFFWIRYFWREQGRLLAGFSR